jgi:PAS domain S-box-containing protein
MMALRTRLESPCLMDERSFQRLLRRTVAVPVALLILLAGVLGIEILTLTESLHLVDHTDQVITYARQALRNMVDMESSARGFELTGDERFLKTFQNAESQVPSSVEALSRLTSDNPAQQARIRDIRQLDENWVRWAEHEIAARPNKKPTEDELIQGDALMEQIRARGREIVAEEESLLHSRTRRATNLSRVVLFTAIGLSLIVAGLLFTLTRRELRELSHSYDRHIRAEAEKSHQLAESRERFQITLNSLADAVIATDAEGKVTYINPVAQKLTGWEDHQEARGKALGEVMRLVDGRSREPLTDPVQIVRATESVIGLSNNMLLINRSGPEYPIEMNGAPIMNDRGQLVGVVVVFRDITQRRQTEQTLRASDRLSQAGRLAATIAHEIRNPLDTVSNLLFLLQHDTYAKPETKAYLDLASEEIGRITQITGQLLTFHREAQSPVDVDVTKVLESVLTLYAPQISTSNIQVRKRFEASRTIRGFPGELRQVFANLVANAVHSMPNGGNLVLHVYESSLTSDHNRKGIRVTVLDNGSGIPPGVRKNLFAPFYTTKGEAGTGLGLWVTRGIIEKHEGSVRFISTVRAGRSGTAFSVFLPFEQVLGKLDFPRAQPVASAVERQ